MSEINSSVVVSTNIITNIDLVYNGDKITNEAGIVYTYSIQDKYKMQPLNDNSLEIVECETLAPIRQHNCMPREMITLLDNDHGLHGYMNKGKWSGGIMIHLDG